jgi:uncharacterized protein YndB with AHSA1/START domain
MPVAEIMVDADSASVWATLADADAFKEWVVGCKEVRFVEGDWPSVGSSIHHRVGAGPLTIDDTTTVEEAQPERLLRLRARARPAGTASVVLTIEPNGSQASLIRMEELVVEGPASHVPEAITDPLLRSRNEETLRRLKELVERRHPRG